MTDLLTDIETIIEDLFLTEDAFTTFNITLRLQKLGYNIKHKDVKDKISNEIENQLVCNYDADTFIKSNVCINGIRFNLYHENGYDINDFQVSKNPNQSPSSSSSNSVAKQRKKKDDTYDKRGRFTVPGEIIDQIAAIGDEVKLVIEHQPTPSVTIQLPHTPILSPCAEVYIMHRHENIFRVSSKYFKEAFGFIPQNLTASIITDIFLSKRISIV